MTEPEPIRDDIILSTRNTNIGHFVTESGETVCGRLELPPGERNDYHRKVKDENSHFIHHDLCHYCNERVPDEIQAELFGEKFRRLEGLTTG